MFFLFLPGPPYPFYGENKSPVDRLFNFLKVISSFPFFWFSRSVIFFFFFFWPKSTPSFTLKLGTFITLSWLCRHLCHHRFLIFWTIEHTQVHLKSLPSLNFTLITPSSIPSLLLSYLYKSVWYSDLVGYIFPFPPCFSLLFFAQLFLSPPQTTMLPCCISFSLGWFGHCLLYSVMNLCP